MTADPQDHHATDTAALNAFEALLRQRRAAPGFRSEPVPREVIDKALNLASQAPSGYNFQPWRYLLVQDPARKQKLKEAANNQAKVAEAPLVIIAFADREGWRDKVDSILKKRGARTGQTDEQIDRAKQSALVFINRLPREVWLNRHVMISFTYLMLAFEAMGYDTAPMEGFDPDAVRANMGLPESTEVIALLGVGRSSETASLHPGRLDEDEIAFEETLERPWVETTKQQGNPAHPTWKDPTGAV